MALGGVWSRRLARLRAAPAVRSTSIEVTTLQPVQTWELYYPEAAATGVEVARARVDPTEVVWLHSARS